MQSRNWCFTINNPTPADTPEAWQGVKYVIYQKERGAAGTEHIQGYLHLFANKRLSGVKKLHPTAHWEPRRGSHEQARAYCMKDDTAIAGTRVEWGDPPKVDLERMGGRSTQERWTAVKRKLDEGATFSELEEFDTELAIKHASAWKRYKASITPERSWKTEVIVCWGTTGTGKSRWAQRTFPGAYWKPRNEWWCGYEGQEVVILDDFYGWLPLDFMLRLLDRYPLLVGNKGAHAQFVAKTIVITSNKEPLQWYKNISQEHIPALLRRIDKLVHYDLFGVISTWIDNKEVRLDENHNVIKQDVHNNILVDVD